ncbi:MAG: DNA-directed RNA polymerase subunit omega [Planctomycetes bacterium]|nr:DNA-directed RNA polymerase subunit omega [Planctomycetota bacterium]
MRVSLLAHVQRGAPLMIEALKSDDIVNKLGGRFKLTALVQRRLRELIVDGARPLIERDGRTDLELVIEEILQGKITPDFSNTGYTFKRVDIDS